MRQLEETKHAGTEELTIVVVSDLFLVLTFGVDNDFWEKFGDNVFEKLESESHLCPIVALLHDVENIAYHKFFKRCEDASEGNAPLNSTFPSKYAS